MNIAMLKQKFPYLYKLYQNNSFVKSAVRRLLQNKPLSGIDTSQKFKGKVFCIGMGKTGTTSVEYVLQSFDYNMVNQSRAEMLSKECYEGNLERLFALCSLHDAFQDAPFCFADFYKKLDERFPESKFILTVRDSGEQWFNSLCRFHSKIYSSTQGLPSEQDLKNSKYGYLGMAYDNYVQFFGYPDIPLYDKQKYIELYGKRNQDIIDYFKDRPDQLLVLNVSAEGAYQELASFLGVTVSKNKGFPHLNKT